MDAPKTYTKEEVQRMLERVFSIFSDDVTGVEIEPTGAIFKLKKEIYCRCCHVDTKRANVFVSWDEIFDDESYYLPDLVWGRFDANREKK